MIGNKCKNIISYLSILTNVRGLVGQTQRGADARQVSSNSIYLYAYFRTQSKLSLNCVHVIKQSRLNLIFKRIYNLALSVLPDIAFQRKSVYCAHVHVYLYFFGFVQYVKQMYLGI